MKKRIEAKTPNQQLYIEAINKNRIIFCDGPAGSGKTIISTLSAIYSLIDKTCDRVVISRPLVQSDNNSGFLPGSLDEKLAPYIRPVMDIIQESITKSELEKLTKEKRIEVVPFGYMRGLTFHNSFIIFDEAQNCTYEQLILGLTRLGRNSKLIISGDSKQSDLLISKQGGMETLMKKLKGIKDIGTVHLTNEDIVREPIIKRILERLNEEDTR
jgi:phosphate starvation-inducible protein PhoH and related proteins